MGEVPVDADLSMGGLSRVRDLPAPLLPGDAVNKAYADGLGGGGGGTVLLDGNAPNTAQPYLTLDGNGT